MSVPSVEENTHLLGILIHIIIYIYINDDVGKCNRIDKCGYHYTPHQYFEDNPHLRDMSCSHVQIHRVCEHVNMNKPQLPPQREPYGTIPQWFMERIA